MPSPRDSNHPAVPRNVRRRAQVRKAVDAALGGRHQRRVQHDVVPGACWVWGGLDRFLTLANVGVDRMSLDSTSPPHRPTCRSDTQHRRQRQQHTTAPTAPTHDRADTHHHRRCSPNTSRPSHPTPGPSASPSAERPTCRPARRLLPHTTTMAWRRVTTLKSSSRSRRKASVVAAGSLRDVATAIYGAWGCRVGRVVKREGGGGRRGEAGGRRGA